MNCTWPEPGVWKANPSIREDAVKSGTYNTEKWTYVPTPVRYGSTFGYEHMVQTRAERDAIRQGVLRLRHFNPRNLWAVNEVLGPARKAGRLGSSGRNYLRSYLPTDWWNVFLAVVACVDTTTGNCLPNTSTIAADSGLSETRVRTVLGLLRRLGVLRAWRTRHGAAYTIMATGFKSKDRDASAPYVSHDAARRGWVRNGRWCGPGQVVDGWAAADRDRFIASPGVVIEEVTSLGLSPLEPGKTDKTGTHTNVTNPFNSMSNATNKVFRHRCVVRRAVDAGMGGSVTPSRVAEAVGFISAYAKCVMISDMIPDHELRHLLLVNCTKAVDIAGEQGVESNEVVAEDVEPPEESGYDALDMELRRLLGHTAPELTS